ncbi:MAG: ATP-binding protein [Epsilonproteobacteria bacterium]|nr:hypothetical protein [Campylobacterota bacterium]NPA56454.1 ATP-binding protein [Campylobacterota bacterium]
MLLRLRNVGMIESADIRLDGLTVIAGENDTGKSSVGKALFSLIKADMISLVKLRSGQARDFVTNRVRSMNGQIGLVFKKMVCRRENGEVKNATLQLFDDEGALYYGVEIESDLCKSFRGVEENGRRTFKDALIIQTPFVWDLAVTLQDIATFNQESELLGLATRVHYPYFLWDLFVKIRPHEDSEEVLFSDLLTHISDEILNGRVFIKDQEGFYFRRSDGFEFPVENLSSGGKSFAIVQSLLANNLIEPSRVIIIDEPEVHLHPKWQLEYAEIIVELVRNGVKVVVATRSPYFVETLEILAKRRSIRTDFYFAQRQGEESSIVSAVNGETFTIYESLAEPIDQLEDREMENITW